MHCCDYYRYCCSCSCCSRSCYCCCCCCSHLCCCCCCCCSHLCCCCCGDYQCPKAELKGRPGRREVRNFHFLCTTLGSCCHALCIMRLLSLQLKPASFRHPGTKPLSPLEGAAKVADCGGGCRVAAAVAIVASNASHVVALEVLGAKTCLHGPSPSWVLGDGVPAVASAAAAAAAFVAVSAAASVAVSARRDSKLAAI